MLDFEKNPSRRPVTEHSLTSQQVCQALYADLAGTINELKQDYPEGRIFKAEDFTAWAQICEFALENEDAIDEPLDWGQFAPSGR